MAEDLGSGASDYAGTSLSLLHRGRGATGKVLGAGGTLTDSFTRLINPED